MAFVLASNNAGKIMEFSELFDSMGLAVVPQRDYGVLDADETGLSFIENALIKARHASDATGLPAIADDSGLVVPLLDGAPGIYSARYSGGGDSANNAKLLDEMKGFKGNGWHGVRCGPHDCDNRHIKRATVIALKALHFVYELCIVSAVATTGVTCRVNARSTI